MLYAVVTSVTFCTSVADRRPGSNWWFWSDPYIIVANAPIVTGAIFVLTFRILLTSELQVFLLAGFFTLFCVTFEQSGMAISISRQAFTHLSYSTVSVRFATVFRSLIPGTSHIPAVPLRVMTFSDTCSQSLPVNCNPACSHTVQWM